MKLTKNQDHRYLPIPNTQTINIITRQYLETTLLHAKPQGPIEAQRTKVLIRLRRNRIIKSCAGIQVRNRVPKIVTQKLTKEIKSWENYRKIETPGAFWEQLLRVGIAVEGFYKVSTDDKNDVHYYLWKNMSNHPLPNTKPWDGKDKFLQNLTVMQSHAVQGPFRGKGGYAPDRLAGRELRHRDSTGRLAKWNVKDLSFQGIGNNEYYYNGWLWCNVAEYVELYNVKPSQEFIDFVNDVH